MERETALELHFTTGETPQLTKTVFMCPHLETPLTGMRGELVPRHVVPFRWTTAIHALSLCFVRALANELQGKQYEPALIGQHGTPASSVDFLIQKSHLWVIDLFGSDVNGKSLLRRIFTIMNSRCTMPGPVQIYVKTNILKPANIKVFLDGERLTGVEEVSRLAEGLQSSWRPGCATAERTLKALRRKPQVRRLEMSLAA